MKKDIERLKREVLDLRKIGNNKANQTEEEKAISRVQRWAWNNCVDRVYDLIGKLDEPEVLSQDWIDKNKREWTNLQGTKDYIAVDKLKNKLVPKQGLPVMPKHVAEYLELAKSDASLMRVLEIANRRDELPKWEKEYDWISTNDEAFARAWLDGYKVAVEEPLYCALVKGHEVIGDHSNLKYWNLDLFYKYMFLGDRHVVPRWISTKMSKSEWNKFGINDSNADFLKVEELEE